MTDIESNHGDENILNNEDFHDHQPIRTLDENHKAFKDPLHVPVGPITKTRSKKIKEALNGLIQEIWADSNTRHSKLDPKEDESVINLIQAIEG